MSEGDFLWGLEYKAEALEQFDRFAKYLPRRSGFVRAYSPALIFVRLHPYEVDEFPDLRIDIPRGHLQNGLPEPPNVGFRNADHLGYSNIRNCGVFAKEEENEFFPQVVVERFRPDRACFQSFKDRDEVGV